MFKRILKMRMRNEMGFDSQCLFPETYSVDNRFKFFLGVKQNIFGCVLHSVYSAYIGFVCIIWVFNFVNPQV